MTNETETPHRDPLTPFRAKAIELSSYVVWSNNSCGDHEEPWRRIAKAMLAVRAEAALAADERAAKLLVTYADLAQAAIRARTATQAEIKPADLLRDLAVEAKGLINDYDHRPHANDASGIIAFVRTMSAGVSASPQPPASPCQEGGMREALRWKGYVNGLKRAINLRSRLVVDDSTGRVLNDIRRQIQNEIDQAQAKLAALVHKLKCRTPA